MILVVGHGPSSEVDPEWVDSQDFVVRCFTGTVNKGRGVYMPHIGTKVDAIVTTQPKRVYNGPEWWVECDYRDQLQELAAPYTDRKLSTGTIGCMIARIKHENEDLGVIGFDTTLHGYRVDETGFWPYHDAAAEGELLRDMGVRDYGKDLRI